MTFSKLDSTYIPKTTHCSETCIHCSRQPVYLQSITCPFVINPILSLHSRFLLPYQLKAGPPRLSQTRVPPLSPFNLVVQQGYPLRDFHMSHCASYNYVFLSNILSFSFPTKLWALHKLKSCCLCVWQSRKQCIHSERFPGTYSLHFKTTTWRCFPCRIFLIYSCDRISKFVCVWHSWFQLVSDIRYADLIQ